MWDVAYLFKSLKVSGKDGMVPHRASHSMQLDLNGL